MNECETLPEAAARLGALCVQRGWLVATAESCTGGLVAEQITALSGSSSWYYGSAISYANRAKTELLGVSEHSLHQHGAVSEAVARAMAGGLIERYAVDVGVSLTGVAGPSGGSAEKPVGTVWIAWAIRGQSLQAKRFQFAGDRDTIRHRAATAALQGLCAQITRQRSAPTTVA